jgi:tetratricopeptide (TPR) repeat protein
MAEGAIRVGCPQCKSVIQAKAGSEGGVLACPRCGTKFKVPGGAPKKPTIRLNLPKPKPPTGDEDEAGFEAELSGGEPSPPPQPPPSEAGPPPEQKKKDKAGAKISYLAMGFWAASAVLVGLSALILWSSFSQWSFTSRFQKALRMHDSGQAAHVGQACQGTLSANPLFHPARQLWAKAQVEAGDFDGAEENYQKLLSTGGRTASVYAGLGALYLRRADQEKDPARAAAHLAKARDYYAQASGVPEGAIGQGLCALWAGVKNKDEARLREAKGFFESALDGSPEKASRAGLEDLYSGLGATLARLGDPRALEFCQRAAQFDPIAAGPRSQILSLRARSLAESPPRGEEYKKRQGEIKDTLQEYAERTTNRVLYGALIPALNEYTAACMIVMFANSDFEPAEYVAQRLRQNSTDPYATLVALNVAFVKAFDPSDGRFRDQVSRTAVLWCQELAAHAESAKAENAPIRATAHNNLAAYKEYLNFCLKTDSNQYQEALSWLKSAVEADAGGYAAHRNMAALLKRNARAESNPDQKKKWQDQADAALNRAFEISGRTEEPWIKADIEKIREFVTKP